ncbi:plastocyanin/azurin family copper-binding protein [Flavobacterium sp. NKUCC04_CG]|uniref:plastocyanin/azurin family copper-binding protein n=1 Tax=Flavobacterium sp. NKUCC04_CG TaxID=2842121 RepID=UPI001C5AFC8B|nr:azurin [Flavobacterium sp. NKUCC04_CG]MBW3519295.1 azurin [Flavobacterium sp. NKUCC04_CG]
MKKILLISTLALFSISLSSCGDKKKDTPAATATSEVSAPKEGFEVTISGDDAMKFDKTEIRVPVGETIILTLKHIGKMDKAIMGHNFVVLKTGVDIPAFAEKAAVAKETDYIPESEKNSIIAHTKTIGGGESTTIEFKITEAGTYPFMCTFPAHYALMKGEIIAE